MDAVRPALEHELAADPDVFVAGIDVGAGGNVFGLTRGLADRFPGRVRDMPISETGCCAPRSATPTRWCSWRTGSSTAARGRARPPTTSSNEGFWHLDAPVVRVAPPPMPAPYAPSLERLWLPGSDDIAATFRKVAEI